MEINKKIKEVFKEYNIDYDNGLCYLMSIFYDYSPVCIPSTLKKQVNSTGILEDKKGNLHWNISLFKNQVTEFDWVRTEYTLLFKNANPTKGGHARESITRMKTLFSKYPEIRKEDILGAVKLYLLKTNYKFIREPHYFIEKGVGVSKIRDILTWVDTYKEMKEKVLVTDISRKLK